MENVVLNEEFAAAGAPMRADFFGDTLVGPTILQWGTEEQKQEFLPEDPQGPDQLVPGLLASPTPGPTSPASRPPPCSTARSGSSTARRSGRRRPSTPTTSSSSPAPIRRRAEAQGHQLPARADEAAGRRGAADRAARRLGRVQRGLLHRRALPEGQRRRRRQQRLEGGDDHPRLRARVVGDDVAPPLRRRSSTRSSSGRGPTAASPTRPSASGSCGSGAGCRSSASTGCAPCPTRCTAPSRPRRSGRSTR